MALHFSPHLEGSHVLAGGELSGRTPFPGGTKHDAFLTPPRFRGSHKKLASLPAVSPGRCGEAAVETNPFLSCTSHHAAPLSGWAAAIYRRRCVASADGKSLAASSTSENLGWRSHPRDYEIADSFVDGVLLACESYGGVIGPELWKFVEVALGSQGGASIAQASGLRCRAVVSPTDYIVGLHVLCVADYFRAKAPFGNEQCREDCVNAAVVDP